MTVCMNGRPADIGTDDLWHTTTLYYKVFSDETCPIPKSPAWSGCLSKVHHQLPCYKSVRSTANPSAPCHADILSMIVPTADRAAICQ